MKFSSLKRDILLLIIRDVEVSMFIEFVKEYLNVTAQQVFYIVDYLIEEKLIIFQNGELILTNKAENILENSNFSHVTLDNLKDQDDLIDENILRTYIPKKK